MTRRSIWQLIVTFLSLICWGCSSFAHESMNNIGRDAWQQPKTVLESLNIRPGAHVADLGAGGGYFTFRLAEEVGPTGKVYAVDIDRDALNVITQYSRVKGIANVEVVQATESDPRLPEGHIDLIFICNTVHTLQNRLAYFRNVARYLRPNGRIAIIDYTPTGFAWLFGHKTSKERIQKEMEEAGYRLSANFSYLSKQHFQIFHRKQPRKGEEELIRPVDYHGTHSNDLSIS